MTIQERVAREIKNELNRFLNWSPIQEIKLGMIGSWDGKRALFTPETDLNALSVSFSPYDRLDVRHDDLYLSADSVQVAFKADAATAHSKAELGFTSKHAFSYQCYHTRYEQIDLAALLRDLRDRFWLPGRRNSDRIGTGRQEWDRDWLIVTAVWVPESYTLLISGSGNARIVLGAKTTALANIPSFNLADINASITMESAHNMAYQLIAAHAAKPFFSAHKLIAHNDRLVLKPYGSTKLFGLLS